MTTQTQSYFLEALEEAKIRQLVDTYSGRGYVRDVSLERQDPYDFDLALRNPETQRVVVFEIKILPLSKDSLQQVEALRKKAEELGYEFRLVTIVKPQPYDIQIDWLNKAVLEFIRANPPSEVTNKVAHLFFESVKMDIESLHATDDMTFVVASGEVVFEVYPPGISDGVFDDLRISGQFQLDIANKRVIQAKLNVDDSEWDMA